MSFRAEEPAWKEEDDGMKEAANRGGLIFLAPP